MQLFGWVFAVVGVTLAAVSARAISDPESPIGWGRWTDDPWSHGLIVGTVILSLGIITLLTRRKVNPVAERRVTRALATIVAATVGFLLFAPFGVTSMCFDGINGGGCRNQDWSTVTGLTFNGNPNPLLGIAVGACFAAAAWLIAERRRIRS